MVLGTKHLSPALSYVSVIFLLVSLVERNNTLHKQGTWTLVPGLKQQLGFKVESVMILVQIHWLSDLCNAPQYKRLWV